MQDTIPGNQTPTPLHLGDPRHSWLAPRPPPPNAINYLVIPVPNGTILSALLITNYAKTPTRGAKLVDIHLDDVLIYQGYIRQFAMESPTQCILFSSEPKLLEKYSKLVYKGLQ